MEDFKKTIVCYFAVIGFLTTGALAYGMIYLALLLFCRAIGIPAY